MAEDVYVVWWQWTDKSGAGIVRVHSDRQRAEEEVDLLESLAGGREYKIEEQPVYDALVPRRSADT